MIKIPTPVVSRAGIYTVMYTQPAFKQLYVEKAWMYDAKNTTSGSSYQSI